MGGWALGNLWESTNGGGGCRTISHPATKSDTGWLRYEYLAFVGYKQRSLSVDSDSSGSLVRSDYNRHRFWLPSDDPAGVLGPPGPATFGDCPSPWSNINATVALNDATDDAMHVSADDEGQWSSQCCAVNLYLKINHEIMQGSYGYTMTPDSSFVKLALFALVFRVLTVIVLMFKDQGKRR